MPTGVTMLSRYEADTVARRPTVVPGPLLRVCCSWDEVVRTHSPQIYSIAYRLTGNSADAEELTQAVFVRVFRSHSTCDADDLHRCLAGVAARAFLDGMPSRTATRRVDCGLQTGLNSLTPEVRVAVVLRDLAGITHEEIAAILGVRIAVVRRRLHRGRAQLHAELVAESAESVG